MSLATAGAGSGTRSTGLSSINSFGVWVKYTGGTSGSGQFWSFDNTSSIWRQLGISGQDLWWYDDQSAGNLIKTGVINAWIYVFIDVTSSTTLDVYYRLDGDTAMTKVASAVVPGASGATGLHLFNSGFTEPLTSGLIDSYKEWSATSWTSAQIYTESLHRDPQITAGLTCYLPCTSLSGADQSGAGNDFTLSGITYSTDKPTSMAEPGPIGTGAANEPGQTASASASIAVGSTGAANEPGLTASASASGSSSPTGTGAANEPGLTASASGGVATSATGAASEPGLTASGTDQTPAFTVVPFAPYYQYPTGQDIKGPVYTQQMRLAVYDRNHGELVIPAFSSDGNVYLMFSTDHGATFTYVSATGTQPPGTTLEMMNMVQDASGTYHLTVASHGPSGDIPYYSRLTLTRNGSNVITGFAWQAAIQLFGATFPTNAFQNQVGLTLAKDQSGSDCMILGAWGATAGGAGFIISQLCASLAPTATTDFTKLDGTAGDGDTLFTAGVDSATVDNAHEHVLQVAWNATSQEAVFIWGANGNEGFVDNDQNRDRIWYRRIAHLSTHTWAADALQYYAEPSGLGMWLRGVYESADTVYFVSITRTAGAGNGTGTPSLDAIESNGTYTRGKIAGIPNYSGYDAWWFGLTVKPDNSRIMLYAEWYVTGTNTPLSKWHVYESSTWTTYNGGPGTTQVDTFDFAYSSGSYNELAAVRYAGPAFGTTKPEVGAFYDTAGVTTDSGTGAASEPGLSASGTAGVTVSATAAASEPGLTATGIGAGVAAASEPGLTASGGAIVTVQASGAATQGSKSAAASGGIQDAATGAAAQAGETASASAGVSVPGTGAALEGSKTAAASAQVSVSATGAATEPGSTAAGGSSAAVSGTGAASQPGEQASASGGVAVPSTGAGVEPGQAASASGGVAVAGTGAAQLPGLTASGGTSSSVSATGAATLPGEATAATGGIADVGHASGAEPGLAASGMGGVSVAGVGAAQEPGLSASGTTSADSAGTGAAAEPGLSGSGAGVVTVSATGAGVEPGLQASGSTPGAITSTGAASEPGMAASGSAAIAVGAVGAASEPGLAASGVTPGVTTSTGAATQDTQIAAGTGVVSVGATASAAMPGLTAQNVPFTPNPNLRRVYARVSSVARIYVGLN